MDQLSIRVSLTEAARILKSSGMTNGAVEGLLGNPSGKLDIQICLAGCCHGRLRMGIFKKNLPLPAVLRSQTGLVSRPLAYLEYLYVTVVTSLRAILAKIFHIAVETPAQRD